MIFPLRDNRITMYNNLYTSCIPNPFVFSIFTLNSACMKYRVILLFLVLLAACKPSHQLDTGFMRGFVDTIGFAHLDWQMDSVVARIERSGLDSLGSHCKGEAPLLMAICPHDDYTYAGPFYYSMLKDVKAKTIILFGVAHKARALGISNKIVFGTYGYWKEPYGRLPISDFQEKLMGELDTSQYMVNDSMQKAEHSLEAIIPFLQHFNRNIEIVPILVPAIPFDKMRAVAKTLAAAIGKEAQKRKMVWGKDYALVISTDAVHYGDEDWGGKNYAPFGADTVGYWMAVDHEKEIMRNCLLGILDTAKCREFARYTVDPKDYREYKWTWCGRYSVPFGLLTGYELASSLGTSLTGCIYGYGTSIDHAHIPVSDLHMGITAPAKLRHWVGYAAAGYR